jgi:Tfp pilus assembly protein PilX
VPPKQTAKDLFSSVETTTPKKTPVKERPKEVVTESSSVNHTSSVTDRIKATHQSGQVSNANRDKGIENAYIAKVKSHMMNWNAVGASGQLVTVNLTIYNSGTFRYTASGVSGSMKSSLTSYLDTLNRMGLGRHAKSTPYSIQVQFRVR